MQSLSPFVIGYMSVEMRDRYRRHFRTLRQYGCNLIHAYNLIDDSDLDNLGRYETYLNHALEDGHRVMLDLGGSSLMPRAGGLGHMMRVVNAFRGHPAVAMWYLCDEPDLRELPATHPDYNPDQPVGYPVSLMKRFYEAVKVGSPSTPVSVAFSAENNGMSPIQYRGSYDIQMFDYYPVTVGSDRPEPGIADCVTLCAKLLGQHVPTIPILQGIGQHRSGDRAFPNYIEFRYLSFACLVQASPEFGGIDGLLYWSYYRALQSQGQATWFATVMSQVCRDVSDFVTIVRPARDHIVFHSTAFMDTPEWDAGEPAPSEYIARWTRSRGEYLMVVNNSNQTRAIEVSGVTLGRTPRNPDMPDCMYCIPRFSTNHSATLTRIGDEYTLSIPDSDPYEVLIYEIIDHPKYSISWLPSTTGLLLDPS